MTDNAYTKKTQPKPAANKAHGKAAKKASAKTPNGKTPRKRK